MLTSIHKKTQTFELQAVNLVKEKLKIDKNSFIALFDSYLQRQEAEELNKLEEMGG